MPETKPEATREAFEKWGNAKGAHIERSWNGEFYENRLVESAWQGFQAGAESSADALEQAREAIRKAESERDAWKGEFNMYRSAWLREIGGSIIRKTHEIDGFVLKTQEVYDKARKWDAMQRRIDAKLHDPFYSVPEPVEAALASPGNKGNQS